MQDNKMRHILCAAEQLLEYIIFDVGCAEVFRDANKNIFIFLLPVTVVYCIISKYCFNDYFARLRITERLFGRT